MRITNTGERFFSIKICNFADTKLFKDMKKRIYILCLLIITVIFSSSGANKIDVVTPSMANKMVLATKTNSNLQPIMFHILEAESAWDFELKTEQMGKDLVLAKTALMRLCNYLENMWDEEYAKMNLLKGLYFTTSEVECAFEMFKQYKKEQQESKEKELLEEEENMLARWHDEGKDKFSKQSKDKRLKASKYSLNMRELAQNIDDLKLCSNFNPSEVNWREKIGDNAISFLVSEFGEFENFKVKGALSEGITEKYFKIKGPATFHFEMLDTIIPVPFVDNITLSEYVDRSKKFDANVKYDKKKNKWEFKIIDREDLTNEEIELVLEFLNDLPEEDSLRNGKNEIQIGIFDHWIEIGDISRNLSPIVKIIERYKKKSLLEKLGDW